MEKALKTAALSLIGLSSALSAAARSTNDCCTPVPPAPCYSVDSECCSYCLGPNMVNPAVRPKTCDGDWVIDVAGFYWNAHQDGMEYAIQTNVTTPASGASVSAIQVLNNLISADYKNPHFKWDFGFKLGIGYNSLHDGWDIGVVWTWYKGHGSSHNETEADDNSTLVTLWSAFAPAQGSVVYATDIKTNWKLKLNLIDLNLGREFWVSKYLTMRPFVGLRIAYIDQDWTIEHKGGSWASRSTTPAQNAFNNEVDISNDFKGVGVRGGLDTVWNLGCGWALFGDAALSIVYGRFSVKHEETNREATAPHSKTNVLQTQDSFHASRAITDLSLGIQWSTMFKNGCYGFTIGVAWEHHMFFDQNQMWRVVRIGDDNQVVLPNNDGENIFQQRRGDLDTQGWTLNLRFEF